MKFKLFTLIFLLAISINVFAQKGWSVNEVERKGIVADYGKAFVLNIDRANKKEVIKNWKRNLEKGNKVDIEQLDNYHHIKHITHNELAEDTIDVYSEIEENKQGVAVYVIVLNDSIYLPTGVAGESNLKIEKHLNKFGKMVYIDVLEKELKAEHKKLSSIETELKKTRNEFDSNKNKITSLERKNEDLQGEIKLKEGDIMRKNEEITNQKSAMSKILTSSTETREAAQEKLKSLEKEKSKLKKEKERMHRQIFKNETDIRDLKYKNDKLVQEEERVKQRIIVQENVVEKIKQELNELDA